MYLIQKIKEIFYENGENDKLEKKKEKKKVRISELNDEIWIYKNDFNKEHPSEEYEIESGNEDEDENENEDDDDEENIKKEKEHFLEVPLFDEDEYGRDIKKNLRNIPYKKNTLKKRDDESELSDESLSTTDEEDVEEPFLDLYEELKREQSITEFYNPMLKPRLWHFEFFIKYIHNLENQKQKNFYLVSFGNTKKIKLYDILKDEVLYTPGYTIEPGEIKYLRIPLPIWSKKELSISYNDLQNFEINIEMWGINGFIFNDLYATSKKTLKEIIENEPDNNIILKKKIEKQNITFEAQCLGVYMQLSEIFEFHMALDSWWFISSSEMPSYLKKLPKFLRFKFPLNEKDWVIHSSYKSSNNFWLYPGYFCFIGTRQQLANSFFILTVLCYNSKYRYKPPILLGSCIISLKSVTEYPFFKGIVKKLTLDKTRFRQGEIVGNIKCFAKSYGIKEIEKNIQRPCQPFSDATLVNQLILNDHYLVIRVIKCENLAISSVDLNNVNINVWVKWDGMVNKTDTVAKTTSPFFYQNLYYPIRLVDSKELTNENLIRNVLPIDLISKGEICFEVHNNNEIYSTILGIFELHFADIFNYGTLDYRSLAQANPKSSSMYNDYKENYEVPNRTTDNTNDNYDDYYVKNYKTIVYKNTLELMYSKVHLKSLNKENIQTKKESTITIEAYVIPPLPSNLVFFNENKATNSSLIYKSLSKRWEKDFSKFNDTYLQWFPKSIRNRNFPCVSKNDFDNNVYPLCSFVTSINLPAQVSTPGPLFHWLNNIEYIGNDDESAIFTPPYFFLSYKKGTIQDHVLLLCCCLKGLEYDAYVCKGTINNGKKVHYWVMTRHENGWICFWEVTNKSIIHLKNRWNNKNFLKNSEIIKQNEMLNKIKENNEEKYYNGEYLMNFVRYGLEELKRIEKEIKEDYDLKEENELYTMDICGEYNTKDEKVDIEEILCNDEDFFNNMFEIKYEKTDSYNCNKALKYLLENFSKYIPISPKMFLIDYENTLAYVPYTSIEIVFNDEQLYGNMQNHHPACILYDFENNNHWRPLLNHSPVSIKNEITISTPLSDKLSAKYAYDLEEEIREMILFVRNKEGLETKFEDSSEIRYFLEMYIDLCEYKLNLDNNYNTKPENYENIEKKNDNKNDENIKKKKRKGKKNENEVKKTWSQYKNDFYPNIEAQYVNKDDLNFYNSYYPTENVVMMNKEQKKLLTNIPEDYVCGMNDEIYGNAKEQYIRNYVFNKDSDNILNNYNDKVKKKNIKRFHNIPVHYKEKLEDISEDQKNEYDEFRKLKTNKFLKNKFIKENMNNNKNKKEYTNENDKKKSEKEKKNYNHYVVTEYNHKINDHLNRYNEENHIKYTKKKNKIEKDGLYEDEIESEHNEENEEELYKEIKEKYYYDEEEEDNIKEDIYYKNNDVPNKFIKKYDKQYDNLFRLIKNLKKKEKIIKEELIDLKLKNKSYHQGKLNKETFCNFVDTQEFLINKLRNKNFEKKQNKNNNYEELINTYTSSDYLKYKNKNMFNGYFIIPSRQIYTENKNEYNNNQQTLENKENKKSTIYYSFEKKEKKNMNEIEKKGKNCLNEKNINSSKNLLVSDTNNINEDIISRNKYKKISYNKKNIKRYHKFDQNLNTLLNKYEKRRNIKMIKKCSYNIQRYLNRYDMTRVKKKRHKIKFFLFKSNSNKIKENNIPFKKKNSHPLKYNTIMKKKNFISSSDKEIVSLNKNKRFIFQRNHKMYRDKNIRDINDDQIIGIYEDREQIKNANEKIIQRYAEYPVIENNMINNKINKTNLNNFQEKNLKNESSQSVSYDKEKEEKESFTCPPKTWSRLDLTSKYVAHQISQWNWYYSLEEQYFNWQYYKFPVPPNHTFVGFPIHFSTIDVTEVKTFLLHSKRFENIMKLSIDNISFLIYCKVYPLIGGVMSNWVFLGCLVPWMTAQERETKIKKSPKKDVNKR
ncbi:conserved Plasmodium protein, unknown function [Plasmodium gallinaceum]|uniref:Centrosomal protein CEP76 n=1 Tax=Plasmodium gallinaceum TaxID=5849 RepID=A0A1J1GRE9_PLAGA|nr:conserved Plasmodium protein, unknown function [Plasmodium gallinaceum]CRG93618.1 conserved Plasmodium protein, unknown function [Plasmodium gallinaceum]